MQRSSRARLVAMLAGLCGVVACSPTHHAGQHPIAVSPPPVPWVDRTASPPRPPPSPNPPHARYRPCKANALHTSLGPEGAAAGNLAIVIKLTNVGHSPCTLEGRPTRLVGVKVSGHTTLLHPSHDVMFDQNGQWPANLKTGQSAGLTIATASGCGANNSPHHLRRARGHQYAGEIIGLPGGGAVKAHGPFNSICGVGVSRVGRPARHTSSPHAYRGLKLSVVHPETALAGGRMGFTVTLSNPTGHDIELSPCPIYQIGIYAGHHPHVSTYRLNCDVVRVVRAGYDVTYAMQMHVPLAVGEAKFSWSIPRGSLFGGGPVTIERR